MSINQDIAVGRYIFLKPATSYEFVREGGRVDKISNQRVYFTAEGKQRFSATASVVLVVDTDEEIQKVVEFNTQANEKLNRTFNELYTAFTEMQTQ